ncbi:MAG: adhesin, partial [Cutibacterium granulosum]|nr:adhesin [Cutibacterium granulosum]
MTVTPDQQYHRAPLNGLIIGTIVGTVCAAVFLLASEGTEFNLAILAVALGLVLSFSLLGWIDGLCER